MTGMRNILVHDYFGIDLTIVWRIVTKNLPATRPLIASLLDSENGRPYPKPTRQTGFRVSDRPAKYSAGSRPKKT